MSGPLMQHVLVGQERGNPVSTEIGDATGEVRPNIQYVKITPGEGTVVTVYLHESGNEDDPFYLVIEVDNEEGYWPALKLVRNDGDVYTEGMD